MPTRRSFRIVPSLERVEPRLAPSGVSGAPQAGFDAIPHGFLGDAYEVMQLFHKLAMEQRASARESREVEREARYEAIQTQVDKMREAANFALAAGIVSGTASIASGAIHLGAASRAKISAVRESGQQAHKTLAVQGIGQLAHTPLAVRETGRLAHKPTEAHDVEALADLRHQMETTMQQIRKQLSEIQDAQKAVLANIMRG